MATKRGPAKTRAFNCSGCKKKRKMGLISVSTIFGACAKYQCPYCGTKKEVPL